MRMGGLGYKPDMDKPVHTLGYILRPRLDRNALVPMPSDPHRAPKLTLDRWPTQRGKR
jgi:hypothetical protein